MTAPPPRPWTAGVAAVLERRKDGLYPGTEVRAPETWLDRLLRVLPFILLAVAFLPYVLSQHPTGGDIGRTLAVVAPTAAWLGWFVVLRPLRVRDPEWLMPAYFAGFLAASVVLIARSPWFSRSSAGSGSCTPPGT
jgi:hypothetical protein